MYQFPQNSMWLVVLHQIYKWRTWGTEVLELAQVHVAGKWQHWDLNGESLKSPHPLFLSYIALHILNLNSSSETKCQRKAVISQNEQHHIVIMFLWYLM